MAVILCALAAALCFVYGAVVFCAGSGSKFYMVWALGGVFFAAFAAALRLDVQDRIPPALRRGFWAVLLVCLVLFLCLEGLVLSGFRDKGRADMDYIIVLGAQVKETGPSVVLRYRLDAALAYLEENPETVCILSGGQGKNEPCSEAEGMYRYLTAQGIAPNRLIMEDRSTDTSENIAFSMAFIEDRNASVGIVTNDFHVFRGVRLARAAGLHNACGVAADSTALYLPNNMVREAFGIMKDLVCGNLF